MASQQPCHHRASRTEEAEIQGPQEQVSERMYNAPHWSSLGIEAPEGKFDLSGVESCKRGHTIKAKMTSYL